MRIKTKNIIKYNKTVLIILLSMIIILLPLLIYFFNNYNKFIIYDFQGTSDKFAVTGNATFSKEKNILNINGIKYYGNDIAIKKIEISLVANIDGKEQLVYQTEAEKDTPFSLIDYLNKYSYVISEQYGYNDYFNDYIIMNFKQIMCVKVEIIDENNTVIKKTIQLNSERYSNNNLFYKKAKHI